MAAWASVTEMMHLGWLCAEQLMLMSRPAPMGEDKARCLRFAAATGPVALTSAGTRQDGDMRLCQVS